MVLSIYITTLLGIIRIAEKQLLAGENCPSEQLHRIHIHRPQSIALDCPYRMRAARTLSRLVCAQSSIAKT